MDGARRNDPDRHAFGPAGVHVASRLDGRLRIGGVDAAGVDVVEAARRPHEDLPQGRAAAGAGELGVGFAVAFGDLVDH